MVGFLLLLPFFLIRFALLSHLNKTALQRAASFAPLLDKERYSYVIYQLSNLAIFIYLLFLDVKSTPVGLFLTGLILYAAGLLILTMSVISFAKPAANGFNKEGIYKISRNPMYVAYFVYFMGCCLLTRSSLLFIFVLIFQFTAHTIILSEERWCIEKFKTEYLEYMKAVRRYI